MHPLSLPNLPGRLPPGAAGHNRGVVRPNYAFIPPEGVLQSRLPAYEGTVVRFLAAPVLGARFAQFMLEIAPGGGSRRHTVEPEVQTFLYVVEGNAILWIDNATPAELTKGGFAYIPPGIPFKVCNAGTAMNRVLALRKRYETSPDWPVPDPIVSHRDRVARENPSGLEGRGFQFLLPEGDMRFDFEMNILWFQPGTYFPAVETHVMEHGLFMLEGQGLYFLGSDWHEIWQDDFIWMGGFCPQQFYATGLASAAYLLYKNMNRDIAL